MIDASLIQRHPLLRKVPRERLRVYDASSICAFWFTSTEYGEFSNMTDGFPLRIGNISFLSSEALYQACRFPLHPEIQREIAGARTSRLAKKISRNNTAKTRGDWLAVRVAVMRWVLRVKAAQHKKEFLLTLAQTGDIPIVEESTRDSFWGAIRVDEYLVGINALGRLLMELRRDAISSNINLMLIDPPGISNFKMFAEEVGAVGPRLGP